ncbi:MAG: hypothetical protein OXI43_03925 [Candidatus Poribacteria bacterium]|nr:hypothetical protein [Candidatus Poribacteria bacterium]
MKMNKHFFILTTLMMLLICGTPLATHAQLFDGKREGLILGGGIGYAAVASGDYGSATGFTTLGKIGYGTSDQLIIYVSSSIISFFPSLGFAYYPNLDSDYFVQGALGYTSADNDSILSISGGMGYELRDHMALEFMLGYNRLSDTYTSSFNIFTGATTTATSHSNFITIAATFNYYFY